MYIHTLTQIIQRVPKQDTIHVLSLLPPRLNHRPIILLPLVRHVEPDALQQLKLFTCQWILVAIVQRDSSSTTTTRSQLASYSLCRAPFGEDGVYFP